MSSSAIDQACQAIAMAAQRLGVVERETAELRESLQRSLYVLQRELDPDSQVRRSERRAAFVEAAGDVDALEVGDLVSSLKGGVAKQ